MYTPRYRTNRKGVPILSRNEINAIAENYVRDFQESALGAPEPLDIEGFLEIYLGMSQDYQYLSNNGVFLGMTVFNETDRVPVYDPLTNQAVYIHADENTVIIDRRLIEDEKQEHRLRYTLGHEAGHGIFHTGYFYRDPNQISFFDGEDEPMIRCRKDTIGFRRQPTDPHYWTDSDWMEWQTNTLSGALLMPRSMVLKLFRQNDTSGSRVRRVACTIRDLITECNVSHEAALYRLSDLGCIQPTEVPCYYPGSRLMILGTAE